MPEYKVTVYGMGNKKYVHYVTEDSAEDAIETVERHLRMTFHNKVKLTRKNSDVERND